MARFCLFVVLSGMFMGSLNGDAAEGSSEWRLPAKVASVEKGEVKEARVDWWGFDPKDSTKYLQAAIDSKARKVVVPNMGKPWITNPLFLRSDLELVLEPGVTIKAIEGGFKAKNDCLLTAVAKKNIVIRGGKGSTLLMRKKDYHDKTRYKRAEWRHGIKLMSCENVEILDLTIKSTGGDGIYVGDAGKPMNYCKDIVIKNCVIDDNNRQGISVISVVNLLIEDCVIKNTRGTAPQAGIDFEPNSKKERLFNITVRNCLLERNASSGIVLCSHSDKDTAPISFNFENCVAKDNALCGFSGGFGPNPPMSKIEARMSDCVEIRKGKKTVFNDFWKDWQNMQVLTDEQRAIVEKSKRIDPRNSRLRPLKEFADVSRVNGTKRLRGDSTYIVYAEKGAEPSFEVNLPKRFKKGMKVEVETPSGRTISTLHLKPGGWKEVSFKAEETGTYIIHLFPQRGGWFTSRVSKAKKKQPATDNSAAAKGKWNMAMLALEAPLHFFAAGGDFYFYVPKGVADFYVEVSGEGGERVKASVFDAKGDLAAMVDNVNVARKCVFSRKDASKGEIWKLRTERPSDYYFEDYSVNLVGVPPILTTKKECLLAPK